MTLATIGQTARRDDAIQIPSGARIERRAMASALHPKADMCIAQADVR
jgi:hypothetical protein